MFHKVQYSDLFFSSFIYLTWLWNMTQHNFLVMQTIPPLILLGKYLIKYLKIWNQICLKVVNCFFIRILKPFFTKPFRRQKQIKASKEEKLLGVRIDSGLTFKEHITSICSKANQRLHALTRVSKYISLQKCRILTNSFITWQFSFYPIILKYCSRSLKIVFI